MLTNFFITMKIESYSVVNLLLYRLRKGGLIKKNNISSNIKKVLLLLQIFLDMLGKVIIKGFYLYIIYLLVKILCKNYQTNYFVVVFIFLTLLGGLVKARILKTSKKKYQSIILFGIDAKEYIICDILLNSISDSFLLLISFLLLNSLLKYKVITIIFMMIFFFFTRLVGEGVNLLYYKKRNDTLLNNSFLYFILLGLFTILLVYFLKNEINISNMKIFFLDILFCLLAILSILYMFKVKDYKLMYKMINGLNSYLYSDGSSFTRDELIEIKKGNYYVKTNKLITNNPYRYLNDIFIRRHSFILKRPILREVVVIFGIGILVCLISFVDKRLGYSFAKLFMRYFMLVFLIIFSLNKTSQITQIMFMNCDRSLLEYDFYRKSESVFSLFKERLKSLILLNLFPILILGIFIDVIFKIYLGMNFLELIYVLIILINSSIIFTLYYLSIYYLVQPYDREAKIKNMRMVVSNLVVSVILLMITRVKVSLYLLTFVMVVVTMIYLLIILYLIKRKSFKTFKLH